MHDSSRRSLLRMALAGGVAVLGGCTLSQSGTVTTATIDVARVVADGRAIVATLKGALAIPGVAAMLAANFAVAEAALAAAGLVMDEIVQLTGGTTVSVSIDTARLQTLVLSLLADAQTVLALLQTPSGRITAVPNGLATLIAAAATLVPLVQLAAGLSAAPPRSAPMSEAAALRIAAGI